MHPACPLSFDDWADLHKDDLLTEAVEVEADPSNALESAYEEYLNNFTGGRHAVGTVC